MPKFLSLSVCPLPVLLSVPAMMQDLVTKAKALGPTPSPSEAAQASCASVTPVVSVRKILMGAGATSPQLLVCLFYCVCQCVRVCVLVSQCHISVCAPLFCIM
jgi:hypothetical protein